MDFNLLILNCILLGYVSWNTCTICERIIRKGVERSASGLFWSGIAEFLNRMAGHGAEILNRGILYTNQEY
jgi:hypothetical protein